MARPETKAPTAAPDAAAPAKLEKKAKWKASTRFVEYRGRKIVIKLVDEENDFPAGKMAMTMNGPAAVTHAHSISIDKDGYVPRTESEEKALLKLANKETTQGKHGSLIVLWENREMPEDQRKAELTAADYRRRTEDLEAQLADKPALEEENRSQAAEIERLKAQLAGNQGG